MAQHAAHFAAHLAGKLALGQFRFAQFVIRTVVAVAAGVAVAAEGAFALRPAVVAAPAPLAMTAVASELPLAARLGSKRPLAAGVLAARRFAGSGVAVPVIMAAVFPLAARLGVKRPLAVTAAPGELLRRAVALAVAASAHPPAASFVDDNRNFGQICTSNACGPGLAPSLATRSKPRQCCFYPSA